MNSTDDRLAQWAISKIERDFDGDVCLLLEHRTLRLAADRDQSSFSYYIPRTNRANGLARTFIIDGAGYDLFPMSWERLERMADVDDYNTTCLADAEILYAHSGEDRQRFLSLQQRLRANLSNPELVRRRARKWLGAATELHREMLFEPAPHLVRQQAGYICDLLALSVALANGQYFRGGQTGQMAVLARMTALPDGFIELYDRTVRAGSPDEQRRLCHELIAATRAFLATQEPDATGSDLPDFEQLVGWYQELRYTWRRVHHFCGAGDAVNAYIWCCMLQEEVGRMGPPHGVGAVDLLGVFDPEDLTALGSRLDDVEAAFVRAIEESGTHIERYASVDEFLRNN